MLETLTTSKHALGYFQVSAVSVRQMYITSYDIWLLGLSRYRYGCDKFTTSPADYLPIKGFLGLCV